MLTSVPSLPSSLSIKIDSAVDADAGGALEISTPEKEELVTKLEQEEEDEEEDEEEEELEEEFEGRKAVEEDEKVCAVNQDSFRTSHKA
jgi:hypothetical protein